MDIDDIKNNNTRFLKVELSGYTSPVFVDNSNKDWVSYGKWNEYPYFLINLMNKHPEHGAIVRGKSAYVFGKGLSLAEDAGFLDRAKGEKFLESANRYETWDEVLKKTTVQYQLYNGWAWQIVWRNDKRTFEVFHIEFGKLRRSKDKRKVYYCDAWMIEENGKYVPNPHPEKDPSYKCFNIFNPNVKTGTQIFYYIDDVPNVLPNGDLYPLPEYESAILQIETDIEISKLRYNYAKWGMFAQSLLSFFNGEPDAKEKKAIKKMFDRTYGGSENAGSIIFSFNDKGGTAPTLTTLTQSDLDKVFMDTRKECQDKIFSAHLTAPVLFGIKTEGSLSDTSGQAILKEWDKFVKTYIEYRQANLVKQIQNLATVQQVNLEGLYIKQTTPVGLDLPSDPNILALFNDATKRKYFAAKYGIEVIEEEQVSADPSVPAVVNENLKKLSGRDWQHIKRLVREVSNGKTSKDVASMMLKNGYALTDQDIEVLFKPNLNFSKFTIEKNLVKDVLLAFANCAIDDDPEDETVSEEMVSHGFAELPYGANGVLDILKGNPLTTPEQIAKQTGMTPEEVQNILNALTTAGLITAVGALIELTPKAIAKPTEPLDQVETYSVYKYVTRNDVPDTKTSSRDFCKEMLRMSNEGKRWTREAIDNLSNGFGFDVWTFRGGWYTNPDDGETTKFCRHVFQRVTKVRRKKK
jgi:transcription initiation factor IIE alpha subunit